MSSPRPESPAPGGTVGVTIGGTVYRVKSSASCAVCVSPYRGEIESLIVAGETYAVVHSSIAGYGGRTPTMPDITQHVRRKHMAAPHLAHRVLLEKRAEDLGRAIEDGVDSLVDHVVTTDAIIQRGWDRLQRGEINPSMGDLLSAIRLRSQWEEDSGGELDVQVWQQAMMELLEAAKEHMSPNAWESFAQHLSKSAVIKALTKKREELERGAG